MAAREHARTRYVVGAVEELPPGSRRLVETDRYSIGVFNVHGEFYALRNLCPHAGGPLCVGRIAGTTVASEPYEATWVRECEILRCPWHGWEFDLTTGATITEPVRNVPTYPVSIVDGTVVVDV